MVENGIDNYDSTVIEHCDCVRLCACVAPVGGDYFLFTHNKLTTFLLRAYSGILKRPRHGWLVNFWTQPRGHPRRLVLFTGQKIARGRYA